MASHKSPLRDRLLSNSPDPIKSSILRESGMGWHSPPSKFGSTSSGSISSGSSGSIISPLRIAKRDSPSRPLPQPQVARRSSSSYKHVRNNNLVSKSPFKSQIPTPSSTPSRPASIAFPSTRRVSGEKRPRPSSMHDQAEDENERPFSLKRERRQSKTFQGLLQKEPVTRSPFRQRVPSTDEPPPALPAAPIHITSSLPTPSSLPVPTLSTPSNSPLHLSTTGPSPVRSSLVSRRMHGPRLSGGGGRRGRRKTVTFDERCDVVEFDCESDEEAVDHDEDSDDEDVLEQEYKNPLEEDPFFIGRADSHTDDRMNEREENASYESIELSDVGANIDGDPTLLGRALDPDTSISGLVDEMLLSSKAANVSAPNPTLSTRESLSAEGIDGLPHQVLADNSIHLTDNEFGGSPSDRLFRQHHRSGLPSPPAHASPHHWTPPQHSSPHHLPELRHAAIASPQDSSPLPQRRKRVPAVVELSSALEDTNSDAADASCKHWSPSRFDVSSETSSTPPHGRYIPSDQRARKGHEYVDMGIPLGTPPRDANASTEPERADELPSVSERQNEQRNSPISQHGESNKVDDSFNLSDPADRSPFREPAMDFREPPDLSVGSGSLNFNGDGEMKEVEEDTPYTEVYLSPAPEKPEIIMTQNQAGQLRTLETESRPDFLEQGSPSPSGLVRASDQGLIEQEISRHRISREDVKRRLMSRKSTGSPNSYDNLDPAISAGQTDGSEDSMSEDELEEKEKDRLSVLTTMTDISAEVATIERAEKRILTPASIEDSKDLAVLDINNKLHFNFGSGLDLRGFGIGNTNSNAGQDLAEGTMRAPIYASATETGSVKSGSSMKMGVEAIDVDMDMRSALDRLMEDVAGRRVEDSAATEEENPQQSHPSLSTPPITIRRDVPDSALLHDSFASRHASGSSAVTVAPPPPPKDNIKSREQMIIEKRRQARRMEESEAMGYYTPPKEDGQRGRGQAFLGVGRPSRRRSMSTGDAETLGGGAKERGDILLDLSVGREGVNDDPLGDTIEKELKKRDKETNKSKYHVREREGTIYASSSDPDYISHMAGPGDVNAGKAWRPVRRPSDMNEYSKQIREYRAQENPGKAYGKVFVKVLGIKGIHLPLPSQPTVLTCTLNNGIHFVSTPECQLGRDARIEQEFELIEHSKLEFTLTLKVRRDPHIIAQFKALTPAPSPTPLPVVQTSSKGGMRSFFSSSPKKSSKDKVVTPPPPSIHQLPENLARYLKPDGTLARAFISFKEVAPRCDVRLFETSYPLIGQRMELGGKLSTLQAGEIVLQMFRLPPLHGISPTQLPQSLEECHRGLRHINWHKVTYFEGTLTQYGGDCSTWRRRQLRVIGANLVAFNDVTKKATATIDLKKAIAIEDNQDARNNGLSTTRNNRFVEEYDGLCGMERSFRLLFPQEQEIVFFADTDEEKARWLDVLRALVGHIPPHPLWAELLWQRQEELTKRPQSTPESSRPPHVTKNQHR